MQGPVFAQDEEAYLNLLTKLRDHRINQGISQAQVAARMLCSKSAVSMMERGLRGMPFPALLQYARAVGAEVLIVITTGPRSTELFRIAA